MIKKNQNKKNIFTVALFLIFIIFISCKSTNQENISSTKIKSKNYSNLEDEPFYKLNHDSFVTKQLDNSIQFIIKKSQNQNDCSIRLVIDSTQIQPNKNMSGLEEVALELMLLGSVNYSALYISSLEYTDSTKFMSRIHQDYIEFGITSAPDKINSMVPVMAEIFKSPLLPFEEFNEIIQKKKNNFEVADKQDSYLFEEKLYETFSSVDSYFSSVKYLSTSEIKYKDVVNYIYGLQNSARIKIIASGNFSDSEIEELYKVVNKEFSKLKKVEYKKKIPLEQKFNFEKLQNKRIDLEKSDNQNANVICTFGIPEILSDEYFAFALSSIYIDDFLYTQVKDKMNFAQDAGVGVILCRCPIGVISIYNIQFVKDIGFSIFDSLRKSFEDTHLDRKLENYKRIYNSIVMSAEMSSSKTLDQMALGLVYKNDALDYIKRPFKVSNITALQVRDIFYKTVGNQKDMLWLTQGFMTK